MLVSSIMEYKKKLCICKNPGSLLKWSGSFFSHRLEEDPGGPAGQHHAQTRETRVQGGEHLQRHRKQPDQRHRHRLAELRKPRESQRGRFVLDFWFSCFCLIQIGSFVCARTCFWECTQICRSQNRSNKISNKVQNKNVLNKRYSRFDPLK